MTMTSQPKIATVIGDISKIHVKPSETASSSAVSAGLPLGKWNRNRIRIKELLAEGASSIGKTVTVKGWIRTTRSAEKGKIIFVELNDGSTVRGLQLVLNAEQTVGMKAVEECGGAGASLSVDGIVVSSPAKGQVIEVNVNSVQVLGAVYGGDNGEIGGKHYPMAKKQHGLEYLREKAHLRPRSKVRWLVSFSCYHCRLLPRLLDDRFVSSLADVLCCDANEALHGFRYT